jgi:dihydrofolate reductase
MSLDGHIAGPHSSGEQPLGEGGEHLFGWYFGGDVEVTVPAGTMTVQVSPQSAAHLRETYDKIGALVLGRKTFDVTNGWGGRHPANVPCFIVTHSIPDGWANDGQPFTFVTDGVESAVRQTRAVAGDKDTGVGAASIAQQCIAAGLLDEIHVDLVPTLLGDGVRLFEHLGVTPIDLELVNAIDAPGVAHRTYRVVREEDS